MSEWDGHGGEAPLLERFNGFRLMRFNHNPFLNTVEMNTEPERSELFANAVCFKMPIDKVLIHDQA